mgnify:CR=1 FL=1
MERIGSIWTMIVRYLLLVMFGGVIVWACNLHLRHCLSPFKTITAILLYQIGKNKRVGSLLAIFRKNTNQEQIYRIRLMPLQNLQHLQPTRREKLAIAYLAQRIGKRTP